MQDLRHWRLPGRPEGSYDADVPSPVSSETRLDVSQRSSTSWSMPQSQFQVRMRRTRSRLGFDLGHVREARAVAVDGNLRRIAEPVPLWRGRAGGRKT